MPAKARQKPVEGPAETIFVPRERMALIYSLRSPTEDQKEILRGSLVKQWPHQSEFKNSDAVKIVLRDIDIAWSEKK